MRLLASLLPACALALGLCALAPLHVAAACGLGVAALALAVSPRTPQRAQPLDAREDR